MNLYTHELPSLLALLFKLVLFAYAARSQVKNGLTRLFLAMLVLLSAFNVIELFGIHYLYTVGFNSTVEKFGYLYFVTFIPTAAVILHISLALSFNQANQPQWRPYLWLVYLPVLPLEYLLLFSNKLVLGFEPFKDSIIRRPGPLYFLFETYMILYLLASFANLIYGARSSRQPIIARTRNRLWLFGLLPMISIFAYLIVASYFGWPKFTTTFYLPICISVFLAITTYAIHEHRLFDIEFYIPWSKVRQRKTAFYDRIRAMIAEIADLGSGSINQAVGRLADTLRCPVAFVDDSKLVLAATGGPQMGKIPVATLRSIDRIVVANEIIDAKPETYAMMKQHGVAAIVPFHPHSQSAASWLLLGDAFSEEVYSPRDFRMVEQLFDKMADLFLDKLVAMRMQLADAQRQITTLESRLQTAESNLVLLRNDFQTLTQENARLRREQPADSLVASSGQRLMPFTLTLLGRDKELVGTLRQRFTQTESYAGPESASFRRQTPPDVLMVKIEDGAATAERRLLQLLASTHRRCAVLLYGSRARDFSYENRKVLVDNLVEVLPDGINEESLLRKVGALAELRSALYGAADANHPLLGNSDVFKEAMAEAARLSGLSDPLSIKANDAEEVVALANYMHDNSASTGKLVVWQASDETETLEARLADARNGTLVIPCANDVPAGTWEQLLIKSNRFAETRLIVGRSEDGAIDHIATLRPFVLEMPDLRQRRSDIALLVHYFTLQFNLQTGGQRYLTQTDIDELIASDYPSDLRALKAAVFGRLMAKEKSEATTTPVIAPADNSKTLEERVAAFEAQVIVDTLKRCDGNKSKAARLLGMRPNTLHYKLERYGITSK